jgi:hypothetical protein
MPIVITSNILPTAVQSPAAANIVLQAGSVVSARVLQILAPDQVRISIAGEPIDVLTKVPLQAGQTLHLQVSEAADGIRLVIVDQEPAGASQALAGVSGATEPVTAGAAANLAALAPAAAPTGPLTPEEALAVSIAAQTAATQQASLAPLFANLSAAAGFPDLPAQVQQAVAQVLAQRIGLEQNLSADDIKQAFQASGLFLEAKLASASAQPSNAAPDLKAALIVLRQVLASSLGDGRAGSTSGTPASSSIPSQGEIAAAVQDASTPLDEAAQANARAVGTTAAALATEHIVSAALTTLGEQSAVQAPAEPIIYIADAEAPAVASPPIAPQVASAASRPAISAQGGSPVIAHEIVELSSVIPSFIAGASPLPDGATRAAASSAALTLLQEALQSSPLSGGNPSRFVLENGQALSLIPAVTPSRTPTIEDGELARRNLPPPPVNGALPAAQPVATATLAPHLPLEATLQHLLTDTDGAIARQTLLQVASLPGQPDQSAGRLDPSTSRWNFEIPFATAHGTAIAQFEISREGTGKAAESAKPVWRARFSLDVEPAGPIHAVISLNGERTSVRMWAERPMTASQLRAKASELSQALSRADLQVGDIVVRDGAPVQQAAAPAGHFLDRAL